MLGVAALVWHVFRRRPVAWSVILWGGGLLFLANPRPFGLPFTGLINNFAVLIMFYIPLGILVGVMLGDLSVPVSVRGPRRYAFALVSAAIVFGVGWG